MWSDSSKHSNDTNIDVPKNTLNITHLKKIAQSKYEVYNSEEDLKEIIFYFNDYSKGSLKDSQHTIFKFILRTKLFTHIKKMSRPKKYLHVLRVNHACSKFFSEIIVFFNNAEVSRNYFK